MPLSIETARLSFRGAMIEPDDAAYEEARRVYNAMIDKRPALIAQCLDAGDVISAVNYGRENQLLTAIRGGGHNGGGLGTCEGGLVIDLSRMRGACALIPRPARRGSKAELSGPTWITRPTPSGRPLRVERSRVQA